MSDDPTTTHEELLTLLLDEPALHRKIVIRRVGGVWLMACPLGMTSDTKPARLVYRCYSFEAALGRARMWVWA